MVLASEHSYNATLFCRSSLDEPPPFYDAVDICAPDWGEQPAGGGESFQTLLKMIRTHFRDYLRGIRMVCLKPGRVPRHIRVHWLATHEIAGPCSIPVRRTMLVGIVPQARATRKNTLGSPAFLTYYRGEFPLEIPHRGIFLTELGRVLRMRYATKTAVTMELNSVICIVLGLLVDSLVQMTYPTSILIGQPQVARLQEVISSLFHPQNTLISKLLYMHFYCIYTGSGVV